MLPAKELEEEQEEDDETSKLISRRSDKRPGSGAEESEEDDKLDKFKQQQQTGGLAASGLSFTAVLIITAEFAERCCYYAITAIYVVYMQSMLNYSASAINAVTSAFNFLGYSFVLLGGWVADRYLGRKKTIIVFGLIYLFSLILLSISASPLGYANFPYNPTWASWGMILSLILIALGMGGVKSNVSTLMADQITPDAPDSAFETAFRYFYFSINLGSLFGMLLSPLVKRIGPQFPVIGGNVTDVCSSSADPYTGYYISFSVFTGFFLFGIIAYMWGYPSYVSHKPQGSLLTRSVALCRRARQERRKANASFFAIPPGGKHWLDWAKRGSSDADALMIDDLKQTMRTCLVFSVFPVYWVLYLQMTNTLVLQATMMFLPGGITPDQMAALDPAFLVVFIPLFDSLIFPWLRTEGFGLNAIQRMTMGYLLIAGSMLVAAGLQFAIYNTGIFVDCSGQATFVIGSSGGINVFTQVPVYFLIAISEIFASITSLEFAYTEAPKSMKSIVMAYSLFQTALGSLLGLILTPVVVEQNFGWLFVSFAIAMIFFAGVFYLAFRRFYD